MQSISNIEAMAGRGLSGDRYCEKKGFWKSLDGCEVTLITQREVSYAAKRASDGMKQQIEAGGHRRNLVISGLTTKQLEGQLFTIGKAVFRYQKSRPPCAYIDRVAGKGMCQALGKQSGVCIEVVTSGLLSVGDAVRIID